MTTRRNMQQIARLGGLSLKSKPAPAEPCAICGKTFPSWLSWLGHLGMEATARKYWNNDVSGCARQLALNSLAKAESGTSWSNGAWASRYRPITAGPRLEQLAEDLHHARLMADHGVNEAVKSAARQTIELIELELKELEA